jgi:ribosome-binding protein aMBF1 (putative translation factor)
MRDWRAYVLRMLSPEQSRAARGWLDWSQDDLAQQAKVSPSTVRDFEKKRRTPIANNLDAIVRAFEREGITFEQEASSTAVRVKTAPTHQDAISSAGK